MAKKTDFEKLRASLERDRQRFTHDDQVAVYGLATSYHTLGHITQEQLEELRALLGLSAEDAEKLRS